MHPLSSWYKNIQEVHVKKSKALFWGTYLGNLFEHYDTALYAFLSPYFAIHFFPFEDPLISLIFAYAILPCSVLVKPIGSLFFGYIADRHNRKEAVSFSLILLSLITLFMAFIPTYQQIGLGAPLLLSLGKMGQSFCSAGEITSGGLLLIEHTEEKKQNLVSSLYNSSTIAGILLASFGVSILSVLDILDYGWRILYLIGVSSAFFGFFLRRKIMEENRSPKNPLTAKELGSQFWKMRSTMIAIALASGFSSATYGLSLVMINGLIPLITSLTITQMNIMNTYLLVFDFFTLPLFGWLAEFFPREQIMIFSALSAVILGIPLFLLFSDAGWTAVLLARVILVLIGVCFSAPFFSWSHSLVPQSIRYSCIGFSYAFGSQVFGAPTAAFSLWLYRETQWIPAAGVYWIILGFFAAISIKHLHLKKTLSPATLPL